MSTRFSKALVANMLFNIQDAFYRVYAFSYGSGYSSVKGESHDRQIAFGKFLGLYNAHQGLDSGLGYGKEGKRFSKSGLIEDLNRFLAAYEEKFGFTRTLEFEPNQDIARLGPESAYHYGAYYVRYALLVAVESGTLGKLPDLIQVVGEGNTPPKEMIIYDPLYGYEKGNSLFALRTQEDMHSEVELKPLLGCANVQEAYNACRKIGSNPKHMMSTNDHEVKEIPDSILN